MADGTPPRLITFSLNGTETTVVEGTSIWDAAHGTGLNRLLKKSFSTRL